MQKGVFNKPLLAPSNKFSFMSYIGFHKLESLWRIDYKAKAVEPLLSRSSGRGQGAKAPDRSAKELGIGIGTAPLICGGRAVITGNAVKGVFRHLLAAQLTGAGIPVCVQDVTLEGVVLPEEIGRKRQCAPDDPCFLCIWFGTVGRQGMLHFSFLRSVGAAEDVVSEEPIPLLALSEVHAATKGKMLTFLTPVKEGTEFEGWISGENLSREILGAIKEVEDMSRRGFLRFGGFKTRGFGAVEMELTRIERYRPAPFGLEEAYEGESLRRLLEDCQGAYCSLLKRGH
jgi:hypothetical protein